MTNTSSPTVDFTLPLTTFVRVGVQRRADARRVADLEKRHLVALDQRLDGELAPVGRLALDCGYPDRLDVGIARAEHDGLLRFDLGPARQPIALGSPP